jgi:hypothetical protein
MLLMWVTMAEMQMFERRLRMTERRMQMSMLEKTREMRTQWSAAWCNCGVRSAWCVRPDLATWLAWSRGRELEASLWISVRSSGVLLYAEDGRDQ